MIGKYAKLKSETDLRNEIRARINASVSVVERYDILDEFDLTEAQYRSIIGGGPVPERIARLMGYRPLAFKAVE